jgi:hypothetical protein
MGIEFFESQPRRGEIFRIMRGIAHGYADDPVSFGHRHCPFELVLRVN